MANSFLTDDIISLEALSLLENSLVLGKKVDRTKDALFGKHDGSNRGATVRIRKPNGATVRTGATFSAQDVSDQYTSFTISTQIGADFALTSAEMAQSLSSFSDQIIKPAVSRIANYIDADIAAQYKNVANSVGTPGSCCAGYAHRSRNACRDAVAVRCMLTSPLRLATNSMRRVSM